MSAPSNILVAVQTYQESLLGALQNYACFLSTSNKRFENFQNFVGQLGTTVQIKLPYRFNTVNSQVAQFQAIEQRFATLTVDNAISSSIEVTSAEFIYNLENDMERMVRDMAAEIGTNIEANLATVAESKPYRFYGSPSTPFTSKYQLSAALTQFRNIGMPKTMTKGYITDTCVDAIVANDLAQFVMNRNEKEANSWELENFSACDWYRSNLLPIHTAGSEGNAASTLTVVSVTKDSDDAVTSITFSGTSAASDANSVKLHDRFVFNDGVSGKPNMRFLTWIGHKPSASPVQFRATANAASTGGSQVTVSIYPALKASAGKNQNINNEIVAGMQCSVLATHRVGMVTANDPFYLAMPRLPSTEPFASATQYDPDTGASLRVYQGERFGQNERGVIVDGIYGFTAIPEYTQAIIFPV